MRTERGAEARAAHRATCVGQSTVSVKSHRAYEEFVIGLYGVGVLCWSHRNAHRHHRAGRHHDHLGLCCLIVYVDN